MGKNLKGKEIGKNLTQRKDGRYEAKYVDQFGRRHTICDPKLAVVRKKLNEALYNKEHSIYSSECKLTLDEWFNIWVNTYYKNKVKEITYINKVDRYNGKIKGSSIGKMKLVDIRPIHIQEYVNSLKEANLKQGTIGIYISLIRAPLKQAILEGYITRNPVDGISIPRDDYKEKLVLTHEEQERFFKYASISSLYKLYKFLLLTGVRINEALALTWDDVDFDTKIIRINKTLHCYSGRQKQMLKDLNAEESTHLEYRVGTPKTRQSIRNIPISECCYTLLKEMEAENKLNINIVFHNKRGAFLNVNNVDYSLKKICSQIIATEDANFPLITPHTFRHTFTTRCIERGVSPKVIQKVLGHATLDMTLKIYTHVTDQYLTEEMSKINIEI